MTPTRKLSAGASREARQSTAKGKSRTPTKDAQIAQAAGIQIIREAGPIAIATRLADREARGDIIRTPEEVELPDEDLIDSEAVDSEISLEDEDVAILEDLDRIDPGGPAGLRPGESFYGEDSQENESFQFELRVEDDGSCWFLRSPWVRGDTINAYGEGDFEELGLRMDIFEALASWLGRERPEFLKKPERLALGVKALKEMQQGLPSVCPGAFLELSGIGDMITASGEKGKKTEDPGSQFSRYSSATKLVWEDGSSLPLKFLFGLEARMAWVACAVKQFFAKKEKPMDEKRLSELRKITRPRTSSGKSQLAGSSISSLSEYEMVALANELADTSWEEVIETHFKAREE